MTDDLQSEYSAFMEEATGREYNTVINVIDDNFLTAEDDDDCGGVIVYSEDKKIVCKNMIVSRLK